MRSIFRLAKIWDTALHQRAKSDAAPLRLRAPQPTGRRRKQKPLCPSKCRRTAEAWLAPEEPPRQVAPALSLAPPLATTLRQQPAITLHSFDETWASSGLS